MPSTEITRRNFLKAIALKAAILTTSSAALIRDSNAVNESQTDSQTIEQINKNDHCDLSLDKYFFNKATQEIQTHGYYQETLSETEVEKLLKVIAEKELSDKSFSTATLSSNQIKISENSARIDGSISIPLGKINFAIELTQEQKKEPIISLLDITGSNFWVDELLQKANAIEIAQDKLTHPYQTIQQYLNERLESSGILVSSVALDFLQNKIKVHVEGSQAKSL